MLAACGGVAAAAFMACGGGDDSTPDAGTAMDGSMMTMDSSKPVDGGAGDSCSSDGGSVGDVSAGDAPSQMDAAREGGGADGSGGGDAGRDGSGDATMAGDGSDGATMAMIGPVNLCSTLDVDWALMNPDDSARVMSWVSAISGDPTGGYATAGLTNDCNVNGIIAFFSSDQNTHATQAGVFLSQVNSFLLQYFNCMAPDAPEAAALTFSSLIPIEAQNHLFTMADLNEMAKLFVDATIAEASIGWVSNFPGTPDPISGDQISQLQSALAALAASAPGVTVNPSTTRFTMSTCDGGASDSGAGDSGAGDSGTGDSGTGDSGTGDDGGGGTEGGADASGE